MRGWDESKEGKGKRRDVLLIMPAIAIVDECWEDGEIVECVGE